MSITPPIYKIDPRYVSESKYTVEELYQLQQKVLDLKKSTDLEKDLKIETDFDDVEITTVLRAAFNHGIINRVRIKGWVFHYYYKYDYPEEKMFEWEKIILDRSSRPSAK